MKPASFEYHAPESLDEALGLLSELGEEARVLAGGQSLIPLMNFRLSQPQHLIDICPIAELDYVRQENGSIVVGAATRQWDVEHAGVVKGGVPLLAEALKLVAHPPIRHRGTVCGSLAHADPAAELPGIALALDAEFILASSAGQRIVHAHDFFRGTFSTAIEPVELLREVRFPDMTRDTGYAISEYSRTHGNFAIAGSAALIRLDSSLAIESASVSVFGPCSRPVRVSAAELALVGHKPSEDLAAEAGQAASAEVETIGDLHGSALYRKRLVAIHVARAVAAALRRTEGSRI